MKLLLDKCIVKLYNIPRKNNKKDYFMTEYQKLTETPVSKLIIMLGIPTTISMLIANVYNMADSYFVSRISLSAGGATSIVFGVMSILQAFGFMFGHGAGSYVSRLLGRCENERASNYASFGFFASLLTGCIIMPSGPSAGQSCP